MAGQRSSSRFEPGPPADWLPAVTSTPTSSRILRRVDLYAQQHRDWFLAFAAVFEQLDRVQSKLLAKTYLFLRTFMPHGLTGRFNHIDGKDLMDYLLCHPGESTFSRHKLTKPVETTFRNLEIWMGTYENWAEALGRRRGEVDNTARKKMSRKAPGLFSPAALLAILIIAYPDPDDYYRSWIGRLQIGWMVTQDPETLNVQSGFWKGLNRTLLDTVFTEVDEPRLALVSMQADYSCILGAKFAACRRDIRPFLPDRWRAIVTLTDEPSDVEDALMEEDSAGGEDGEPGVSLSGALRPGCTDDEASAVRSATSDRATPQTDIPWATGGDSVPEQLKEVLRLRECLNTSCSEAVPRELERWLIAQLLKDGKVLSAWCKHWEKRIDEAENALDQALIRSLFIQNLCRLRKLLRVSVQLAEAFMILCIAEGEMTALNVKVPESQVKTSDAFGAYLEARTQFSRSVYIGSPGAVARLVLKDTLEQQLNLICNLTADTDFAEHWLSIVHLETLYTQLLVVGCEDPSLGASDIQFWQRYQDDILNKTTVESLKLSGWQVRALLRPRSLDALTDLQKRLVRDRICPELTRSSLWNLREAAPVQDSQHKAYPDRVAHNHPSLCKLIEEFRLPTSSNIRPSPTPTAAAASTNYTGWLVSQSTSPQSISPSREATISTPNRFTGKGINPAKRPRGPSDTEERAAKLLQLYGPGTRGELLEEVQGMISGMKADLEQIRQRIPDHPVTVEHLQQERTEHKEELHNISEGLQTIGWQFREVRHLESEAQAKMDEIKEATKQTMAQHTDKIQEVTTESASRLQEISTESASRLQIEINQMGTEIRKLASNVRDIASHQQDFKEDLTHLKDAIQDISQFMQPKARPTTQAGDDGYLTQFAAPASWKSTQKAYTRTLLCAAWSYIGMLGNPDHSAWQSGEVLGRTLEAFPGLDEDHLVKALDHVHMQGYDCLLPEE